MWFAASALIGLVHRMDCALPVSGRHLEARSYPSIARSKFSSGRPPVEPHTSTPAWTSRPQAALPPTGGVDLERRPKGLDRLPICWGRLLDAELKQEAASVELHHEPQLRITAQAMTGQRLADTARLVYPDRHSN